MTLSSGSWLGPYEILEPLGAGGMAEVYRARDRRLNRDVAVKVLPRELSADEQALSRFRREARAVAALSHPNILAIHDFGAEQGTAYAVTELLEGQTLRERLEEGALTPRKAVALSIQIMSGLAAAHDKGIVHRDLKPENLFLTGDGRLKILDFGLATYQPPLSEKAESATLSRHTEPGTILGTIGYMAPEQARGREATFRSDIFSFGAILQEMLAGKKAFQGDSAADTLSAILKEDPPELPAHVPPVLRNVVRRCLEKDENERFQSARDVGFALQAISDTDLEKAVDAERGAHRAPAVAVLPFTNMSPDPEQDYFCEGMAEEIINALTRIEGLRVASRMSAFQFKDRSGDIRKIGEALNVTTVLQGSVRTSRNRLRVVAQLTNVDDGYQIWSERYDREMEDVFAIQDAISESIVSALRVQLVGEPALAESKRRTDNLEAYQLYLKGQHNWYKRYKDSLQKATRFFEAAVEKDPSYARAHASLADTYSSLAVYGYDLEIARSRARVAVERALALDERLSEAHGALGLIRFWFDWDWEAAEQELQRAIELNPSYVLPYCWLGFLFSCTGRSDEAVAVSRRAQELDPLSPYVNSCVGVSLVLARRIDEGIDELERSREMDGDFPLTLYFLGWAYMQSSRPEQAMQSLERAATLAERASFYLSSLAWAHAAAGQETEAIRLLEELHRRSKQEYIAPIFFAWILGELGRKDEAFEYLNRAYEEKSPLMAWLIFPMLDTLRSDARFEGLLQKMKLPAGLM